ncbi:MAG: hypothetical protein NC200_08345 [Candidatus Gastranaerophilales bacterium]|nr:hypothetical protein [Candidatus Gastranaerophilales bacterium]
MNIKNTLRAAAIAIPMMLGGGKAAAQAPTIVKAAEKVVAADTLKAMEQKSADVPTLMIKRYKGHFQGSVKGGKIADGTLNYKESGETVPVANILNPKSSVAIDGTFVSGSKLPGVGYQLGGTFEKGNNAFSARGVYSQGHAEKNIIGDMSYTRSFPLTHDISATGKVGVEGGIIKNPANHDSFGQLNPHISAGAKYSHTFEGGAKIGAKAEVGGALPLNYRTHTRKAVQSPTVIANGEIEAGYKNISGFVTGGRDAMMGNNIGAGVRVKF